MHPGSVKYVEVPGAFAGSLRTHMGAYEAAVEQCSLPLALMPHIQVSPPVLYWPLSPEQPAAILRHIPLISLYNTEVLHSRPCAKIKTSCALLHGDAALLVTTEGHEMCQCTCGVMYATVVCVGCVKGCSAACGSKGQ